MTVVSAVVSVSCNLSLLKMDGGRGVAWPCGWGWAEGWCKENKGSPRKNCRDRERETERKEREAPLQLLCTGGGSPSLLFLHSLHAAARLSAYNPLSLNQLPDFRLNA